MSQPRLVKVTFEEMLRGDHEIVCKSYFLKNSVTKFGIDFTKPMQFSLFLSLIGRYLTSLNIKNLISDINTEWFIYTSDTQATINKFIKQTHLFTTERKLLLPDNDKFPYYRHFKGKWYITNCLSNTTDDSEEKHVVYTRLYDPWDNHNREINEFLSLRDQDKYPNYKQKYRFSSIYDLFEQYGRNRTLDLIKQECPKLYNSGAYNKIGQL